MIYQFQNSIHGNKIKIIKGYGKSFVPHLHNSFELVFLTEGEMRITVDKKPYTLISGDSLLIFPNQIHEFVSVLEGKIFICIFSPDLVDTYLPMFKGKLPASNLIRRGTVTEELLSELSEDNILISQSILYFLCARFHEGTSYTPAPSKDKALIEKIFSFIEQNYRGECTLGELAAYTSYNYVYLSRYFKSHTSLSFIEYVNGYRIDAACCELKDTDKTVLSIAYECGFESLRNFNRVFKKLVGMTPKEYRQRV